MNTEEFLRKKRPGNIALLIALSVFVAVLFAAGYARIGAKVEHSRQAAEKTGAPAPEQRP